MFFYSPLEQFDVINVFSINLGVFLPFLSVIVPFILLLIFFYFFNTILRNNLKIIPKPIQLIFEKIVEFIFDLIKQQIGKEAYLFFPLIFVLFVFVLFTNLLGLIPFGIALTSHIIMIL